MYLRRRLETFFRFDFEAYKPTAGHENEEVRRAGADAGDDRTGGDRRTTRRAALAGVDVTEGVLGTLPNVG